MGCVLGMAAQCHMLTRHDTEPEPAVAGPAAYGACKACAVRAGMTAASIRVCHAGAAAQGSSSEPMGRLPPLSGTHFLSTHGGGILLLGPGVVTSTNFR